MFWWNEAVEVIEATEVVEAVEVTEIAEVLWPEKSLLKTSELTRFLNSALFWCFETKIILVESWNIILNLAPFLLEAVEASWCYFFENWFKKLKIYNLLKPLDTIIQQNYWSFYPSELIYFAFFTMRQPVDTFGLSVVNQNLLMYSFF
jgi:hypothetical protein